MSQDEKLALHDYVWDPKAAEVDELAAELERRLAPLGDEVDALVDSLDLDEPERDEAVILTLPGAKLPAARERSWPWLAAALILLCASVLVLAGDQRRRASSLTPVVEVGGPTRIDGRVSVGVHAVTGDPSPFAVLVALREAHDELARCALELETEAALELRVGLRLDPGVREIDLGTLDDAAIDACVRTALEAFDATPLGHAELELDIHLQTNNSEEDE